MQGKVEGWMCSNEEAIGNWWFGMVKEFCSCIFYNIYFTLWFGNVGV